MGRRNGGFTLVEALIVIGILACIVTILLPGVQAVREASRRATCAKNMGRLGSAMSAYAQAYRKFPPSSTVSRNADGTIAAVDGWSWLVLTAPYREQYMDNPETVAAARAVYETLNIADGRPLAEPTGAEGTPHADALAISVPELLCPSYGGSPYANPATKKAAITNYKGNGATHIESLSVASPKPLTPKYGCDPVADLWFVKRRSPVHPDGTCFPGDGLGWKDLDKGTSNLVVAVESIEPRFARWTVGAEAAVVGLPPNVEFEKDEHFAYLPKGYRMALAKNPEAETSYWTYRTYLEWDFDRNAYDGADGSQGGRYGPSSNHPLVVHHLWADGAVRSIPRDVDVSMYMYLLTRHY